MSMARIVAREQRLCEVCEQVVEFDQLLILYTSRTFWMAEEHDAPCGAPCACGPVSGGRGAAHGVNGECPRCGTVPFSVRPGYEGRPLEDA